VLVSQQQALNGCLVRLWEAAEGVQLQAGRQQHKAQRSRAEGLNKVQYNWLQSLLAAACGGVPC
jgi:hypothetical protein